MQIELTDAEAATVLRACRVASKAGVRLDEKHLDAAMGKLWQARWDNDDEGRLAGTKFFGREATKRIRQISVTSVQQKAAESLVQHAEEADPNLRKIAEAKPRRQMFNWDVVNEHGYRVLGPGTEQDSKRLAEQLNVIAHTDRFRARQRGTT